MSSILTVSQLNRYMAFKLKEDIKLRGLLVKGEISGFTHHMRTGHFYFTLKDRESSVKAVMFSSFASRMSFMPRNGMSVIVMGSLQVFERDGVYQIYVTDIQPDGVGAQFLAFEQLKEKLAAEGLFDTAYKKPLPRFPSKIGIVTAKGGAALQDILNILSRRYPVGEAVIFPCVVQGDYAVESICEALVFADGCGCDVIICGRGGGSPEDLAAFNSEKIARTVFAMQTPVISAVGHETDTTIIDYVADLRAPTPSAAAELAVTQVSDIENEILDRQDRLYQRMGRVLQHKRQQADQMEMRLKYLSPASRIREKRTYSIQLEDRLQNRLQAILRERRHNLALYIERMKAVSPLEKLNSGFSYVEDTDGKNIRSVIQVEAGERLRIRVSDGVIDTRVEQIQKEERLPG